MWKKTKTFVENVMVKDSLNRDATDIEFNEKINADRCPSIKSGTKNFGVNFLVLEEGTPN